MHSTSRISSLIFFTLFTLCLPAQLHADTINFFEHLSLQHKIKFLFSGAACLVGMVGACAINISTNTPANNNGNNQPPAGGQAADSNNSTLTLPNTVPKFLGTLLCGVVALAGGYFANEASYGR